MGNSKKGKKVRESTQTWIESKEKISKAEKNSQQKKDQKKEQMDKKRKREQTQTEEESAESRQKLTGGGETKQPIRKTPEKTPRNKVPGGTRDKDPGGGVISHVPTNTTLHYTTLHYTTRVVL